MSYRTLREGEYLLYGTVHRVEPHTPKGRLVDLIVVGHKHVGIYELNRRLLPRMPSLDKAAFCLFTNSEGVPVRLYIRGRKIYPVKGRRLPSQNVIVVRRLYVPYNRQGSFNFVAPWE